MRDQQARRILLVGALLALASTLVRSPIASGDGLAQGEATPSPEIITIFADKDSLNVYVLANVTVSLQDLNLEYQIGKTKSYFRLADLTDLAPYVDGTISEPFCLHLERASSPAPFPLVCNFAHRPTIRIPDGSVFWWSQFSNNTRTLLVNMGDTRLGICDTGFSRCDITIYPPAASATPAYTHTPASTSTDVPTSTQTPIPTKSPTPTQTPTPTPPPRTVGFFRDFIAALLQGDQPIETPKSFVTPTETPTPFKLPTEVPSSTPSNAPIPTPTAVPTKTPIPTPDYGGRLAIPMAFGYDEKVYVTGLDGKGINGPNPNSIDGKQPVFGPDGESLLINGNVGGLLGVFLTDGWGQAPQRVIDTNSACWPVLSPDGSEIMYSETSLGCKLHRRQANGDDLGFEVTANNRPILAKNLLWTDDNRLVFYSCATWRDQPGDCGIWVTNADTIDPKRIVVGNHAWPTDAKHGLLTFMSAEDGDWDVYLMSLDGGQLQNITDNESQDGMAAIAPDGRSVAYISDQSGAWALWTITLSDPLEKKKWFEIDPQRGSVNVDKWHEERMSWTQ